MLSRQLVRSKVKREAGKTGMGLRALVNSPYEHVGKQLAVKVQRPLGEVPTSTGGWRGLMRPLHFYFALSRVGT